jgi:hypothetical protein
MGQVLTFGIEEKWGKKGHEKENKLQKYCFMS